MSYCTLYRRTDTLQNPVPYRMCVPITPHPTSRRVYHISRIVPNDANMISFGLSEFVWMLKHGTLLHHHGPIDRIVNEYVHTRDNEQFVRDLIAQTGSRDAVLESAYLASLLHGNPFAPDPCPKTMPPSRACSDTPSPPDPMPPLYRTRTRSRES